MLMLIPFIKLFNQATKAGSSDHLILLPGTKLHSKVGKRQDQSDSLRPAQLTDMMPNSRLAFLSRLLLGGQRYPPLFALSCFRGRSRNRLQ